MIEAITFSNAVGMAIIVAAWLVIFAIIRNLRP